MSIFKFVKVNKVKDGDDTSAKLLNQSFQLLVDFVEKEKAVEWAIVHRVKNELPIFYWPFSRRFYLWYRNPEVGVKRLEEEMEIVLPGTDEMSQQAMNATEILILYNWWTQVRPKRKNPEEELLIQSEQGDIFASDVESEEKMNRLVDEYDKEDQEMLKRLVEVRHALWS